MRRLGPSVLILIYLSSFAIAQSTGATNSSTSTPSSAPPAQDSVVAPANSAEFTPEQVRKLIQTVTDNDQANDKKSRDYTYIQREEDRHLDGDGKVKKTESTTSEVLMIYGSEVDKEIAKDD